MRSNLVPLWLGAADPKDGDPILMTRTVHHNGWVVAAQIRFLADYTHTPATCEYEVRSNDGAQPLQPWSLAVDGGAQGGPTPSAPVGATGHQLPSGMLVPLMIPVTAGQVITITYAPIPFAPGSGIRFSAEAVVHFLETDSQDPPYNLVFGVAAPQL